MGLLDKFKKKGEEKVEAPLCYSEKEMTAVENHVSKYFGSYESVFHEIYSPDIHVDIIRIDPSPERNYYTLVTMGAGAYKMVMPEELEIPKRAEYYIKLPSDWDFENLQDFENYWPMELLKYLARLPLSEDTWLGYGHTAGSDEENTPFADNTKLCCVALSLYEPYDEDAVTVALPNGEEVIFYQMVPIYADELEYKLNNEGGLEALEELLGDVLVKPLDINRQSCVPKKKYH